ncbi:MAG: hypothetical protein IPL26_03785 [Leptospiraceae bacterium]|nr:hypothetical protein [Leptospiraceae bacterium]
MKLEKYRKTEGDKINLVVRKIDDLDSVHTAIVFIFLNQKLQLVEFHSKRKGIVKYHFKNHTISGNTWESEDSAQNLSHLNYHFTGFVLNEATSENINLSIISEVVHDLLEVELTTITRNLLESMDPTKEILTYFGETL